MKTPSTNKFRFQFPSEPEYVFVIRDLGYQISRRIGYPEDNCFDIKTILGHLSALSIRKLESERRSSPIFLEIITHPLRLELIITDFSLEPYWKTIVPYDLNEYREDGYGLFLIQKISEHISYESIEGKGNKIKVLYKKKLS